MDGKNEREEETRASERAEESETQTANAYLQIILITVNLRFKNVSDDIRSSMENIYS